MECRGLILWFSCIAVASSNLITINKPLFDPETNDDIVNATTLVPITTIDSNHKYIERPITIAENSTAFLKCVPEENEFRNAEWLVENTSRRLINSISTDGSTVSVLTILDVTKNDTGSYSCRKSPKVIERFHLNVHVPTISISDRPHIFVRYDGTINLTCIIESVESPDEITWNYNGAAIDTDQTQWQSKNRICLSEGTENCFIRSTFKLILRKANLGRNGRYSCATENIHSNDVYIEVLNTTTTILGSSGVSFTAQSLIFEFAIEALELYGVQKAAADYVRDKIAQVYNRGLHWNCFLAPNNLEHSISNSYEYIQYVDFKIGSISFSVHSTVIVS